MPWAEPFGPFATAHEEAAMPMPRWWARMNKRTFNPRALAQGNWPVLTHVGRVSGESYRTPLGAERVDGGFLFVIVYGSSSDWVRNVLAAGRAELRIDGQDVELTSPRIVGATEAAALLSPRAVRGYRLMRIHEFLRVDADIGTETAPA